MTSQSTGKRLWALLIFLSVSTALATNHILRMDEVMAGMQGDTNLQYIVITTGANDQKDWGPQFNETESRAMLVFFDATGTQTAVFKFPNDPPSGGNSVLIATAAFTNRTGLRADIIMPPLLNIGSGKVCFKGNPANPNRFDVNLCLSYGDFPPNLTEGAGSPAPALPFLSDPQALVRFQNFTFGSASSRNADFRLDSPHPTNTLRQGVTFTLPGPEISVTPIGVEFGNQAIGLTQTLPITIRNVGATNTLRVTNVTLVANPDEFQLFSDSGQTNLGPFQTRTVQVTFFANTNGFRSASLRIASNDADEPLTVVQLTGRGIETGPCLAPDVAIAAAMDSCSEAMLVGPGFFYRGNNFNATRDGSAACDFSINSRDVWYRYVAGAAGSVTVSIDSADFDTILSAHFGCPGANTNQIACNDDFFDDGSQGGSPSRSRIFFFATNRQEVLIRIAGKTNASGNFQMSLTGPPAFNFDVDQNGVNDTCEFDLGDAPAPFPTTIAQNGARHRMSGRFLGLKIDHDDDGQPSADANADNTDGAPNDDDGVTFVTPLVPGQLAAVSVIASSNGILNAWIDFNGNGSWADAGDQIFTNRPIGPINNNLTFNVPASAAPTNRVYARFRFSGTFPLGFVGLANDGETEDYMVEIQPTVQMPSEVAVQIDEVMAGLNGDSSVQFVELRVLDNAHIQWGPGPGESAGRAMLAFYDAAGRQSGRFVFPSNAPSAGGSVLIATRRFAEISGLKPDFIMPPDVMPIAGKIAFRHNPDNQHFDVNIALSYGGSDYFGSVDGAGPANPARLAIMGARSLTRVSPLSFGLNQNNAFSIVSPPTPTNSAGATAIFTNSSLADQGRVLFNQETFLGNGRTCFTCHRPGRDQFGLTPATIATLPHNDPLFIFEDNVNRLRLTTRSQPSDLRGIIFSTNGSAKVLGGSGDTYFIAGGRQLMGTISDANGNSGVLALLEPGDLDQPTPSNRSPRGLEDHDFLEHGRGLILENIDGFRKREVFRGSPHLLDLQRTAPYGLSGEFANLRDFSAGAVLQHFPRSMRRAHGVDFRNPTTEELQAMEAFMFSITSTRNGNVDLNNFVTTEAQKRGRTMFFNNQGKCFLCHNGPVLNRGSLGIPTGGSGKPDHFNTGVANLLTNILAGLPTEPPELLPGQSTRRFNTPSLFGIRLTAPYFHNSTAPNLREALKFYDTPEFLTSIDGLQVGSIAAVNDTNKLNDLVAFLESLVDLPVGFPRTFTVGVACTNNMPVFGTVTITNTSTNVVTIRQVSIVGTNATNFVVEGLSPTNTVPPGGQANIQVSFLHTVQGLRTTSLEIEASDPELGVFSFGITLRAGVSDSIVTAGPTALQFLTRGIDPSANETLTVTVTNTGSTNLIVSRVSIAGTNANQFSFIQSLPSQIAAGATGVVRVAFAPTSRGFKIATLEIETVACQGALFQIPLSGVATSRLDHFTFGPVGPTLQPGVPFPVSITARDRNNDILPDFSGPVHLLANSSLPNLSPLLITEVDPGATDRIEFQNLSDFAINLTGWRVVIYDPVPEATLTIPLPSQSILARSIFTLTEGGTAPGFLPNLFAGTNITWVGSSTGVAVLLLNPLGQVVDFFTTSPDPALITNPIPISGVDWSGDGVPAEVVDGATTYQRVGASDHNDNTDWVVAEPTFGFNNTGLLLPPTGSFGTIPITPEIIHFTNSQWSGAVTFLAEGGSILLRARASTGEQGSTTELTVLGSEPIISTIPDQTMDEDSVLLVPFTVADAETLPDKLSVTPFGALQLGLSVGGSGSNRVLRIAPVTNLFGTFNVTVSVTDRATSLSASFNLTITSVNDPPVILTSSTSLIESFDSVTPPALPSGWSAVNGGGAVWATVASSSDTPPNSAFVNNPSFSSDSRIESPPVLIVSPSAQLTFRHSFSTESCCDGGFVEMSIGGGTFVNVTSLGATFALGAYNAGSSWRGFSGGFITTTINLPASASGQSCRFRWRFTTDSSVGGTGWFVDSIALGDLSVTNETGPIIGFEDILSPALSLQIIDPDTPPQDLLITATSSDQAVLPNTNIVITTAATNRVVRFLSATNQSGPASITINVNDGFTNVSRVVPVLINAVDDPPIMAAISNRFAFVGELVNVPVNATDVDDPPGNIAFSLPIAPAGASIGTNNGLFTWTPSAGQLGSHLIRILARDVTGSGTVTQQFTVQVESAPLIVPPIVDFGVRCLSQGQPLTANFTNTSTNALLLSDFRITGADAASFSFTVSPAPIVVAPGGQHTLGILFIPSGSGARQALVEISGQVTNSGRMFVMSMPLRGTFSDGILAAPTNVVSFGTPGLFVPAPNRTISITNRGASPVHIFRTLVFSTNSAFILMADTGQTNLLPGDTRTFQIAMSTQRRGAKSGVLQIESVSCEGALFNIPLSGMVTSALSHFTFDFISSPQAVGAPFNVRFQARDGNADIIDDFTGPAQLSLFNPPVNEVRVLSWVGLSDPDEYNQTLTAIRSHFTNFSESNTTITNAAQLQSILVNQDVLLVPEQEFEAGELANLGVAWGPVLRNFVDGGGTVIVCSFERNEHLLLANAGLMSITKLGHTNSIALVPGAPSPLNEGVTNMFTGAFISRYSSSDGTPVIQTLVGNQPVVLERAFGSGRVVLVGTDFFTRGTRLDRVIANAVRLPMVNAPTNPLTVTPITWENGVGTASATVHIEAGSIQLALRNNATILAGSSFFSVFGALPVMSAIANQTVDEDGLITLPFTVGDQDTIPRRLFVDAQAANTALFGFVPLVVDGSGSNRVLTLRPATNQFGSSIITLSVNDGVLITNQNFLFTVRPINDAPSLVVPATELNENFDAVIAPALPVGWVATNTVIGHPLWRIVSPGDQSANAVFITNVNFATDARLESPMFRVFSPFSEMTFRHSFQTEACCDSALIEIAIGPTGTWVNVTSAGGFFLAGAYNSGAAWRGFSGGFMTSTLRLPNTAAGQLVRLRWRFTSDAVGNSIGWFVDNITVRDPGNSNTVNSILTIEDASSPPMFFLVNDAESGPDDLIITAESSNPSLLPAANVLFGRNGVERFLRVTPALNQFGTANLNLRVSDGLLSVTHPFTVNVAPVNDPPVLGPLAPRSIHSGEALSLPIVASDVDDTVLAFSLQGAPPGAQITPGGVLSFGPTNQPGVYSIPVRVADQGTPALSAVSTLNVTVLAPLLIQSVQLAPPSMTMSWNSAFGRTYRVQYATNLANGVWLDLPGDITASGSSATKTDTSAAGQRFYRVIALP